MNLFKNKILITLIIIFFATNLLECEEYDDKSYYISSKYSDYQFEINQIEFKGNTFLEESDLNMLITMKKSYHSFAHKVVAYYDNLVNNVKYTPPLYKSNIRNILDVYINEITFYNEVMAYDDALAIKSYYNINGWHFCNVSSEFHSDTVDNINILTFKIDEAKRYKIANVEYRNLDTISAEIKKYLFKQNTIDSGEYFNENKIITVANTLKTRLKNRGYYYANFKILPIIIDRQKLVDSIIIVFDIGIRQRNGYYKYFSDNKGHKGLAKSIKDKYNFLVPGRWYNEHDLKQTQRNLTSLGLFEKVIVDTMDIHSIDTLNYRIFTQLRNRYNINGGPFLNHTPADDFVNAGIDGRFTIQNPFGASEEFSVYGNATVKDVDNIFNGSKLELQGKFGVQFSQPLLFMIGKSRIGAGANAEYSRNNLNGLLVDRWFLPKISFPWFFRTFTYFNKFQLNISFEGERPINYNSVLDNRNIVGDEINFFRNQIFYKTLDNYWTNTDNMYPWTATIVGATIKGDHRNHPFSPTKGTFTMISIDGAAVFGIAEFFRFQFKHSQFFSRPLHPNRVHALRLRIGAISYDNSNKDKYVPFDRQFYAGGANSNRGWLARHLHSSQIRPTEDESAASDTTQLTNNLYRLISNIYGNAGVFELSYEYRYNFVAPKGLSRSFAEQVSSFGLVAFVDIGNAYGWFADENDRPDDAGFIPYLQFFAENIAVSAGLGLRYETPIGPVRVDFGYPINGPVFGKEKFILNRVAPLKDYVIHFGIGHSF